MAYDIIFVEKQDAPVRNVLKRGVGENVFLSSLPTNPKVFAFFFPGSLDTGDLEKRLRSLGERTGDNLFVNMASLADPDYDRAQKRFRIGALPTVVVTAISPLAVTPDSGCSATVGEFVWVRAADGHHHRRPRIACRRLTFNHSRASFFLQV